MHYSAVEKTIGLYILIIGGILSTNSFMIKQSSTFSIFALNNFQIFCSFFISTVGLITTLKVIEHRILIITYVKSLNLNRKWFFDNITPNEFIKYSLFTASYKSPKYFKRFRHFYWEILGISIINSSFFALFFINIFKNIGFQSKHAELSNWLFFVIICIIVSALSMGYYKVRGEHEELDLSTRGLA
jgi:hypothetical protein